MPNRVLYERICESETIETLTSDAERFFYRLLVKADDFGRFHARPSLLRAACFPLALDRITDDMVQTWLLELSGARLVTVYEVDGREYLTINTWARYQRRRAEKSKYPDPSDCEYSPADASEARSVAAVNRNTLNEERETIVANDGRERRNGAHAPAKAKGATKTAGTSKATTPPPERLEPDDADYAAGAEVGLTREQVALKTAIMLDHFRGKGESRSDWHAALRNWLRNAPKFDQPARASPPNGHAPPPRPTASAAPVSYLEVSEDAT